jgi:acyl-CoA thioesterase I
VIVFNGSESGDTTADALQRLPSALQNGADLVTVELGGNDMLNETDPQTVFDNLDQIIRLCKAEGANPASEVTTHHETGASSGGRNRA